jgi:hypothetical protein
VWVISAAATMAILAACGLRPGSGELRLSLAEPVRRERLIEVDLASIRPFEWGELFVFGPYTTREAACRSLDLAPLRCHFVVPRSSDEGANWLAFRNCGRLVHWQHHSRGNRDFEAARASLSSPIEKTSARFAVLPASSAGGPTWAHFGLEHAPP